MEPDMKRVRVLRNRLRFALKKEHPINTIPAMQTYTVEEVIRMSPTYEAAVAGLQAIHNDWSGLLTSASTKSPSLKLE